MKYVLLIINTPLGWTLSPDEASAWSGEIFAWYDKLTASGKLADSGFQFDDISTAKTIRGTTVTDGPFIETKEVIGGYSVLEADRIDEAVEIAKTWPGVERGLITIEVRPIFVPIDFQESDDREAQRGAQQDQLKEDLDAKLIEDIEALGGIASIARLPQGRGIIARLQPAQPGEDLSEPPEVIPVAVYLDTDDHDIQEQILKRVDELVLAMGYDKPTEISVEYGSIFRKAWARIRRGLSSAEVRDRLVKVERAIELEQLDRRQAEVDVMATEAVRNLLDSLDGISAGCFQIGSILLVKYQAPSGPHVLSQSLSQDQIRTLKRYPEILSQPDKVFTALALAVSTNDVQPDRHVIEGSVEDDDTPDPDLPTASNS